MKTFIFIAILIQLGICAPLSNNMQGVKQMLNIMNVMKCNENANQLDSDKVHLVVEPNTVEPNIVEPNIDIGNSLDASEPEPVIYTNPVEPDIVAPNSDIVSTLGASDPDPGIYANADAKASSSDLTIQLATDTETAYLDPSGNANSVSTSSGKNTGGTYIINANSGGSGKSASSDSTVQALTAGVVQLEVGSKGTISQNGANASAEITDSTGKIYAAKSDATSS